MMMLKKKKEAKNHDEQMGCITLIPFGNIPERMLAMASAISYFSSIDKPLEIVWIQDNSVMIGHERLFAMDLSLKRHHVNIHNAKFSEKILLGIPNKKNLFIPTLYGAMVYDTMLLSSKFSSTDELRDHIMHELSKSSDAEIWLGLNCSFYNTPCMFDNLSASVEVLSMLRSFVSGWQDRVIGVHIERDRSIVSWRQNPTDLFIRRMQKLIEEDPSVHFFLSTDDYDDKDRIATIFGSRVFSPKSDKEPGTIGANVQLFAEMLALSKTEYILGNKENAFCKAAALIGELNIEQISIYA